MNTETLLNQVAEAIKHRPTSGSGKYFITILQGRIVCIPTQRYTHPEINIYQFTEDDAKNGFTSAQWKIIKNRLFKFYERIKT